MINAQFITQVGVGVGMGVGRDSRKASWKKCYAKLHTGIGQANRRELHTKAFSFQNEEGHETRNQRSLEEWQVVHYCPSYFLQTLEALNMRNPRVSIKGTCQGHGCFLANGDNTEVPSSLINAF